MLITRACRICCQLYGKYCTAPFNRLISSLHYRIRPRSGMGGPQSLPGACPLQHVPGGTANQSLCCSMLYAVCCMLYVWLTSDTTQQAPRMSMAMHVTSHPSCTLDIDLDIDQDKEHAPHLPRFSSSTSSTRPTPLLTLDHQLCFA